MKKNGCHVWIQQSYFTLNFLLHYENIESNPAESKSGILKFLFLLMTTLCTVLLKYIENSGL